MRTIITILLINSILGIEDLNAQTIQNMREQSRQVMRTRLCGVCHIPPGNEKALKIFDLNNENWSATMTEGQLLQIKWRIKVKGKEVKAMRGDPKKHQFTKKEIKLLSDYVDAEISDRKTLNSILKP